jgi:putative glycosyltransferase (TIGR04372 family)
MFKILKNGWYLYNKHKKFWRIVSIIIWFAIPKIKIITEVRFIKNILYLSALGAQNFEQAAKYLNEIEKNEEKNNPDLVRRYYLGFASVAKQSKNPEILISLFEHRAKNHPDDFWVWRVLIDTSYFLGKCKSFKKFYLNYLNVQKKYKSEIDLPLHVNYFGSYVTNSIGHLTYLADLAVAKNLGLLGKESKDVVIFNETEISNTLFLECLKNDYYFLKKNDALYEKIFDNDFLEKRFLYLIETEDKIKDFWQFKLEIYQAWHTKSNLPILELPMSAVDHGITKLRKLGIFENDWFVVLHVRQALDGSLRNADINTYLESILEVTSRGGWVIRIGDNLMPKLPKMEKVIDLAHASTHDGNFDVFLLATCKFSIVSNSGPAEIPFYFLKNRVITNIVCIKHAVTNPGDIVIPIFFYNKKERIHVKLKEVLESDSFSTEINIRKNKEIELKYNSSEEIHSAVCQMISFVNNNIEPLSKQQLKFSQVCKESGFPFQGAVSASWSKKYANLI